jgi:hypothetical protein
MSDTFGRPLETYLISLISLQRMVVSVARWLCLPTLPCVGPRHDFRSTTMLPFAAPSWPSYSRSDAIDDTALAPAQPKAEIFRIDVAPAVHRLTRCHAGRMQFDVFGSVLKPVIGLVVIFVALTTLGRSRFSPTSTTQSRPSCRGDRRIPDFSGSPIESPDRPRPATSAPIYAVRPALEGGEFSARLGNQQ